VEYGEDAAVVETDRNVVWCGRARYGPALDIL
jgi:hypothetical protein